MIGFEQTLIRHSELKTRWRPLVPTLFPIALLTALAPIGCGPADASCAATATCPPSAEIDATSDVQRDGGTFVGTDVNGHSGDAGSEADRAPPMDAMVSPDVARDAPLADQARSDGSFEDARGQDGMGPDGGSDGAVETDAGSDAPVETDGGTSDGAVPTDAGPIDAPLDSAPCELDAARSPYDNPCLIHERYGVFVSPAGSDATGAGTRAAPYRTLARALQAAKFDTRRVYACDNGTGYADSVTLDATLDGMDLFGGFNCATWMLNGVGRTQINATLGPALTARGLVVGVTFERFDFASANAETGASSIAVLLDTAANVVLRKARIVAGRGGTGYAGSPGDPGADGNVAGPEQDGAPAECNNAPPLDHLGGAWAQASVCGSRGGTGQPSNALADQQAESGVPMTGVTPANQTNGGGGFLGNPAGPGSPGNPGAVGAKTALTGTFSANGYAPAPLASAGTDGRTGQGGGGGVKGFTPWSCNLATGGAGGMGGCGGKGGLGGAGGGASVGVLSWSSSVSFDQCEIVAAAGGAGGSGGNGGKGGVGMPGGRGGAKWVDNSGELATAGENGGKGGAGGDGGSGAGGNGGPSHALVYKGARPATSSTTLSPGAPGDSGVGGYVGGVKAPDGAIGTAGPELML